MGAAASRAGQAGIGGRAATVFRAVSEERARPTLSDEPRRGDERPAVPPGSVGGRTHGTTELFIQPGFKFQVVDGMVTNFHLPGTSLLLLVSSFAGEERIRAAYAEAVKERYRFYSYGDAMLIS